MRLDDLSMFSIITDIRSYELASYYDAWDESDASNIDLPDDDYDEEDPLHLLTVLQTYNEGNEQSMGRKRRCILIVIINRLFVCVGYRMVR